MHKLSFQHLLSSNQITRNDIDVIFSLAEQYLVDFENKKSVNDCQDYILATLFFEPSTRTRFSFESAMIKLNGKLLSLEQGAFSSITKGETLEDMGRVFSKYADLVVIRHPEMDSAFKFAKYSSIPVINGGDGANEHPTQSLADLFTILKTKKRLNNLKIGLVGDLKYSRTSYSLIKLLSIYQDNEFTLISPQSSKIKDSHKDKLIKNNVKLKEADIIEDNIEQLDVLYVVRVQKERFENIEEYNQINGKYLIDNKLLSKAKDDLIILHPLPRVDEVAVEVDESSNAKYFLQAELAVFIRMALLNLMKDNKIKNI